MAVQHKSPAASALMLKNAAASPFLYFDNVPALGAMAGNLEIELASRVLMPKADGGIAIDLISVAHLRCTPQSALMLIDALQRALAMHNKQMETPSQLLDS